jgi:hypothetical protein
MLGVKIPPFMRFLISGTRFAIKERVDFIAFLEILDVVCYRT